MPKLILIEGLRKYEGISEVDALSNALQLMKKSCDGRRARHLKIIPHRAKNKKDFIRWLQKETDFLHISAHGERENGITTLKITQRSKITPDQIKKLTINARVVFVNACQQAHADMANAFLTAGKPKIQYYIAPKVDVPFDEAFIVALLFYKKAFIEKRKRLSYALKYVYKLKDIRTNYWYWESP